MFKRAMNYLRVDLLHFKRYLAVISDVVNVIDVIISQLCRPLKIILRNCIKSFVYDEMLNCIAYPLLRAFYHTSII